MWFPSRRLLWLRMYPRGFRQTKEEEGPGWTFPPLIRLLASGKPTHTRTLTWRRKRVIRKENGECWPRRTHTTGETKRRDMTGHMHSRSPSSSSVSLFFFYLSLLYRDFFFALPYLSQVVFLKVFLLLGERLYRHLRAEPNLASHGGELKLRFFFFQLSTFNDMQQVKKKKTKFFLVI